MRVQPERPDRALRDDRDREAGVGGRGVQGAHQAGAAAADDGDVGLEHRQGRSAAGTDAPAAQAADRGGGVEPLRAGRRCSRGCSGSGDAVLLGDEPRAARARAPSRVSAASTIARLSAAGPRKPCSAPREVAGSSTRRTPMQSSPASTALAARRRPAGGRAARPSSGGVNHGSTLAHASQNGPRVDDQVADDGQARERLEQEPSARGGRPASGRRARRGRRRGSRRCRTSRRGTSSGSRATASVRWSASRTSSTIIGSCDLHREGRRAVAVAPRDLDRERRHRIDLIVQVRSQQYSYHCCQDQRIYKDRNTASAARGTRRRAGGRSRPRSGARPGPARRSRRRAASASARSG